MRLLLLLAISAAAAFGHHSFAAEYDGEKPVTLKGVVTKIEWENPHTCTSTSTCPPIRASSTGSSKASRPTCWCDLVVVVGFNDRTWIGAGGASIHSDALHVVERYQRVDFDTITYDVRIEDPQVFTKSWSLPSSYLSLRPGERLREYECIADNQDLLRFQEILKNPSLFVRPPQ